MVQLYDAKLKEYVNHFATLNGLTEAESKQLLQELNSYCENFLTNPFRDWEITRRIV